MRYLKKRYLLFWLVVLLCAGCGKTPTVSDSETFEGNVTDGSREQDAIMSVSGEDTGTDFQIERVIQLEIEDPDESFSNKTLYSGSYGSMLYLLASYQLEGEDDPTVWMYTFDLDTLNVEKHSFSLETPNMEKPYVASMTVTNRDELTFRLYGSLEGRDVSSYLYRTDLTGRPLDEETPFSDDTGYLPENGKYYAVPDSSPILVKTTDSMTTSLFRYDAQSQIWMSLATINDTVNALCSDGQEGIYYVDSAELKYLNLSNMNEEVLCRTAESGIKLTAENWLLCDGEGKLALCSISTSNPVVYLLTNHEAALSQVGNVEYETICMTNLNAISFMGISNKAANWSVLSDKYRIDMEDGEDSQALDAIRNRTLAELAAGEGPELIYVSQDDLRLLAEKGILMDMEELIPEDVQEQILPGVRQMCTVDGTWVGIAYDVYYCTLMTNNSLWNEDSWTVSDMLDIAEAKNDWDWILSRSMLYRKPDAHGLFNLLFSRILGDSPFFDLENGISYFNNEVFVRTLEFCKRYGQSGKIMADSNDELWAMLQEGKSIAKVVTLDRGLLDFSDDMASYQNCHYVGFPGETGSGNYVYTYGYLVVNANAKNMDAVKEFIAYLLDYDIQFSTVCSVRKDVLRDQVTVHPQVALPAILLDPSDKDNGFSYNIIDSLKPDGTTYLEEFIEFVESCEPIPYCPEAITEIVEEEIDAFFTGNRSAKETADIIHRRVQLYFDER